MAKKMRHLMLGMVLAATVGIGAPGSALADTANHCSGTWSNFGSCTFVLAGPHFTVRATSYTSYYSAQNRVGVSVYEPNTGWTLFQCESHSSNYSDVDCYASNNLLSGSVSLPVGVPLECRVSGSDYWSNGDFSCSSWL